MLSIPRRTPLLFAICAMAASLAAVQVAGAGTARAQNKDVKDSKDPKDPKDAKAAAKEHFQRGTSFYDLGRFREAIKEFEAAYHLKNDPAFLYNLAQSYRLAGDPDQALHFYRTYLRYVPKAPNRTEIEERIKALEAQVAAKGAAGTQPPPSTGETAPPPVGTGMTPTPTPPPATVTPPPVGAETTTPPFPPGTTTAPPHATPPPFGAPPPANLSGPSPGVTYPGAAPGTGRGRTLQTAGIATAGAGGVLLVIGIVQGLRARSASRQVEDSAINGTPFDPDVEKRGQSAEKWEAVTVTLGILAGAAGAGLWYYGRRVSAAENTISYKISFAPAITRDGGFAWLRVGF